MIDRRGFRCDLFGDLREFGGGDQDFGLAVFSNIQNFIAHQVGADSRVNQTGSLRSPDDLHEMAIVLHEDRYMVAGLKAECAEQVGAPIGALLQLQVADFLAGAGNDKCCFIRSALDVISWIHGVPCAHVFGCIKWKSWSRRSGLSGDP